MRISRRLPPWTIKMILWLHSVRRCLYSCLAMLLALTVLDHAAPRARGQQTNVARQATGRDYVGSEACAPCHREIYKSYLRTDMGRSMSGVNSGTFNKVPSSASIFDQRLNRHFELYLRDGSLYQSEYELGVDGKAVFRETHKIDWLMGAGANGVGAIVRRDGYLFEAPLSYYSNINAWGLSPGYQFADYGFSRPVLPACIACHSGRSRAVPDGNGKFEDPPFTELAIGCENCHGPGAQHVLEQQIAGASAADASSIINPAKLTPGLANDICVSCHQAGEARVLHTGKQFTSFRPGSHLDDTLSIFVVPFASTAQTRDDLLDHYLSMRMSKCYRSSGGRLTCLSCHDPHVQPSPQDAPAYFREKCMACHADKGCSLAPEARRATNPPDDCIGCHMPKRDVSVISHSVLTNHRVISVPEEPFPDVAYHMATPQLPDLIHLTAPSGKYETPSPITMLQAYRQVMLSHPEYRERYWTIAKKLSPSFPNKVLVLQALADFSLQKKTREGNAAAIRYLTLALSNGSKTPADFEQLGGMLVSAGRSSEAIPVLKHGIELIPFDLQLYRLLAMAYISSGNQGEACEVLNQALNIFPQDARARDATNGCDPAKSPPVDATQ